MTKATIVIILERIHLSMGRRSARAGERIPWPARRPASSAGVRELRWWYHLARWGILVVRLLPHQPEDLTVCVQGSNLYQVEDIQLSLLRGHPSTEKGKRPEENQVSSMSGSCESEILSSDTLNLVAALLLASASLLPHTQ